MNFVLDVRREASSSSDQRIVSPKIGGAPATSGAKLVPVLTEEVAGPYPSKQDQSQSKGEAVIGRNDNAIYVGDTDDSDSTFTPASDSEEAERDRRWKANNVQDEAVLERKRLLRSKLDEARRKIDKSKHKLKKAKVLLADNRGEAQKGNFRGALELFCGCGELTVALGAAGFNAIGVDCKYNKDTPKGPYLVMDLSSDEAVQTILQLIVDKKVVLVHLAPPCGTASRAREIKRKGLSPKPLRSDQYPDGLPDLVGEDLKRVEQANKLYKFTAELICALERCKVAWSVENPTSSSFWKTSFMQKAVAEMVGTLAMVDFDMCMHGGGRKTSLPRVSPQKKGEPTVPVKGMRLT